MSCTHDWMRTKMSYCLDGPNTYVCNKCYFSLTIPINIRLPKTGTSLMEFHQDTPRLEQWERLSTYKCRK